MIPYPPGGTVDVMMRALQDRFQRITGQPLVIDNKGGAAGVVGMQEVARAAPDGYTIGFTNSGLVIAPLLQRGPDSIRHATLHPHHHGHHRHPHAVPRTQGYRATMWAV